MRPNKSLLALRQAKAANSFYLTRKDCTSILPFNVRLYMYLEIQIFFDIFGGFVFCALL